jgi:hypothetical protein
MQISNDAKINMIDGAYKDFQGLLTSPRDPSDVGVAKSHVVVPYLHHLDHLSAWSNY